jgi:hypothetical protein
MSKRWLSVTLFAQEYDLLVRDAERIEERG